MELKPVFGKNKIRGSESSDGTSLQVAEIFYTLQGEGPYSGKPAVFIRLTGCNLRCWFCDTKWDDEKDPQLHVSEVMQQVNMLSKDTKLTNLVVLTGGEPMRQQLRPLIERLVCDGGYEVQIETAGTYWQPDLLPLKGVLLVCSPKTKHVHPLIKEFCDHWKYVISSYAVSEADGLPYASTQVEDQSKYGSPCRPPKRDGVTIWLSPCDEYDEANNRANKLIVGKLALQYGYRAQVQMHKELDLP